jgi:hypothetical protein
MQPCREPAVLLKYSLFGLFAIQQQANIAITAFDADKREIRFEQRKARKGTKKNHGNYGVLPKKNRKNRKKVENDLTYVQTVYNIIPLPN